MSQTCSVDGCVTDVVVKGWCKPHYMIAYRNGGDPLAAPLKGRRTPCSVPACQTTTSDASGYCAEHKRRSEKYGDPLGTPPLLEEPSYARVHQRLRAWRGSASTHRCGDCGEPAEEWSYDYGSANERRDERGRYYSVDTGDYSPRCKGCHRAWDTANSPSPAVSA